MDVLNKQVNLHVHQSRLSELRNLCRTELDCPSVSSLPGINPTSRNDPTAQKCWDALAWTTLPYCPLTPVRMILMSEGHVTAGPVVAGHIEVGPVVAGHIEVGLCPLLQMYHTWPSSVQHIQGPLVNSHDNIPGHAEYCCCWS